MSAITYGNSLTSSIGYDTQYRLSSLATGTFQNLTYGYDNNGNITSIAPGKTYSYDTLDRLGTATGLWGGLGWTYDGVGNRQTENSNTYTYAPNTNKLTSANGVNFGYDNNGNTATQSSRVYTYNENQRLIQVADGAMNAGYNYNGNGQRVKKNVNGTVTIFHYSLNGQIIAESNSAGTITAEYVYLNGEPLAKMEGAHTYYYHPDHLGTPQKMTDASGVVVWSADYKPFGEATVNPSSTITNNLRFPGQYYDAETGLLYNMNRTYNRDLGRYIESDPIGIAEGENPLYVYANNNPVNSSDPLGLWTVGLHKKLTQNALMKVNCGKAAGAIAAANAAVDSGDGQLPENAYRHAMSNGKENPPNKIAAIAWWQSTVDAGKTSCDEKTIGKATHALQDYFAPAHSGFKQWSNHWWEYFKHIGDATEGAESAMAENATAAFLSGIAGRCPCLCK